MKNYNFRDEESKNWTTIKGFSTRPISRGILSRKDIGGGAWKKLEKDKHDGYISSL